MRKTPLRRKTLLPNAATPPLGRKRKPRSAAEFDRIYGSEERVEWVKSLPCVVLGCGQRDIENMHIVGDGVGRKADADKIVAACHGHHQFAHNNGVKTFAKTFGLDLKKLAAWTEEAWQVWQRKQHPNPEHISGPLGRVLENLLTDDGDVA